MSNGGSWRSQTTSISARSTVASGPSVKGAAAQEAVGALVALGYASSEANAAVRRSIEEDGPEEDAKELIRKALAYAGG